MTAKEAMRILALERDDWETSHCTPSYRKEAFDMAIKALTAQDEKRTENAQKTHACDLIERQAAIRWVKTECNPYGKPTLDFESGKKVIEHLKQMTSAQADLPIKEKCAFCPHCNNCDVNDDLSIQPCVDTISRQAVIENICTMLRNCFDASDEMIESVKITVGELPSAQPDNQTNLCDSCNYSYPDCPSKNDDVIFGNGIGNDNICACNKYKPSAQPEPSDVARDIATIIENEKDMRVIAAQPEPCDDAVSRKAVYEAMVEKGQHSRRYKLGEIWELNGDEIREALDTVPSAQPEQRLSCKNCIHLGHGYMMPCQNCKRNQMLPDWYEV